jgi:hypothetical protein
MSSVNTPLSALLHAFRRHSDLRRSHAPLDELAAARWELHRAGMDAYHALPHPPR